MIKPSEMRDKADIRREARAFWQELTTAKKTGDYVRLERSFEGFLRSMESPKKASVCLAFYPLASEFNVLKALRQQHWSVALPLVGSGYSLSFHLFLEEGREVQTLTTGAYGIQEPRADSPVVRPSSGDVLIVPSMAANSKGFRLGKGGGFYDRLMEKSEFAALEKWAVLPEKLLDAPFEAEAHDLRLDRIITEERIVTYP